jgi:CheY-like chemotaxis protein
VIAVGNGADAIERAQRDRPDIVLADVGMPERNGYEVAAFIKGSPHLAHIPVVLLTGAFEPVDEGRAREVGCDGVLVKPFEPQMVISRVKDLLAGRQPPGMWGSAPVAQGPVRPAAAPATHDFDGRGAAAASPANESLEAYFDHLDAAFASSSPDHPAASAPRPANEPIPLARRPGPAAPSAPATRGNDPFADWDPDIQGDPARPASAEPAIAAAPRTPIPFQPPAPPPSAPAAAAPPPPAAAVPPPPPPLQIPSLVEAFTALLSAEQAMKLTPSAATVPPAATAAPEVSEALVEAVSSRVLARLTEESRPAILDVAERLVREEIERIKQSG